MNRYYFIVILFCVYSLCSIQTAGAQQVSSRNFLVQQGKIHYLQKKYATAEKELSEWINMNPSVSDTSVFRVLADCYWMNHKYADAYQMYWRLNGINQFKFSPNMLMQMSDLEAMLGNYEGAAKLLSPLKNMLEKRNGFLHITEQVMDSLDWKLVYPSFNTIAGEYLPYIYQNYFILTSDRYHHSFFDSRKVNLFTGGSFTRMQYLYDTGDISCSIINYDYKHGSLKDFDLKNERKVLINRTVSNELSDVPLLNHSLINWTHPIEKFGGMKTIGVNPGNPFNVAYLSVQSKNDSSGKTYCYYMGNRDEKKWKREYSRDNYAVIPLALFRGEMVIDKAGNLNIDKVSAMKIEGFTGEIIHATVSRDGRVMVFSGLTAIKADYDLYYTTRKSADSWENVHAFGTNINTERDEVFPQFQDDGTLYFSSDGLPGLGALDIFSIPFYCKGIIGENGIPEHLGYPLNSAFDDFGLTISSQSVQNINKKDIRILNGYFSTNRKGSDDIYRFYYREKYIQLCGEVYGTVSNSTKPVAMSGTRVKLNLVDEKGNITTIDSVIADRYGQYCLNVRPNRKYDLEFAKPGWITIKNRLATDIPSDPPEFITYERVNLDQVAKKINKSTSHDSSTAGAGLEKVFIVNHKFNRTDVVTADLQVLDSVIAYCKAHVTATVEMISAADCIGTSKYADKLSERRALYMSGLLEDHGITIKYLRRVGQRERMVECLYPLQKEQQLPNRYTKIIIRGGNKQE